MHSHWSRSLVVRLAGLALAAWAMSHWVAAAQSAPVRPSGDPWAQTRARFDQPSWPTGPSRSGLANAPSLQGWVADAMQSDRGRLTRSYRAEALPDAPPGFVLESWVADSAVLAQEQLLEWLSGIQSPQRVFSARDGGLVVGDIAFASRSGAADAPLAWVAFVRGNVAVRLRRTGAPKSPEADLSVLALTLDRAIVDARVLEAGATPPKPVISAFEAPRPFAQAGEVLRLTLDLVDPAAGEPHLEWIVGGDGQGYVERAADGAWEFHATGPGEVKLALEVTGSTGTFARAETMFTLSDD